MLRYCIEHYTLCFLSALLLSNELSSIPSSTLIRSACISFQTVYLTLHSAMLSMDGLFHWIGTPWAGFTPLNFFPHSSITIITLLAHPTLHIRHSSFRGGAPLFPGNSSCCLPNSILIYCKVTSLFQHSRYHKLSQTSLEYNFAHLQGPNHTKIQWAPLASLHRWWIVWSCVCRPWWDGRCSGWHWHCVGLMPFDCLVGLLYLVFRFHFWITLHFLWFLLM